MNTFLLRARYWVLAAGLLLTAPALWSCNSQTTYQKQLLEHQDQLKQIDDDTIKSYLNRNGLASKATRTNSGLYVVGLTDGTGTAVTTGKRVRIRYIGKFLSNGAHAASSGYPASPGNPNFPQGSIFENTADNHTACGCIVFPAGSNALGLGFDEGLLLSRVGDRKLFLIPSRLAYGPGGSTGVPADSALLYDIEILEIF